MIRIGPAGWSYPDSPGHVYPAGRPKSFDVLAYTASYFDTIEINASFYAPQPVRNYASWVKRVGKQANFKFTAKLWQRFTHGLKAEGSRLKDPWTAEDVRVVAEGMQVLQDAGRLGAILAQFPWSFQPSAFSLQLLADLAEAFAPLPIVVELRHGAWARHEHAVLLKRLGLGFCNIDQPVIGESLGPTAGVTSDLGYVRFHGRRYDTWFDAHEDAAQRYDYLYSADELTPWVERIRKVVNAEGVKDVYVISNNHFEGKGPANALMIRSMLEGRKVPAPPVLFETYREALAPWAEPVELP